MSVMNYRGDEIPRVAMLELLAMVPDGHSGDVLKTTVAAPGVDGLMHFKGYGQTEGFVPFGTGQPDKTAEDLAKQLLGDDLVAVRWADKNHFLIGAA